MDTSWLKGGSIYKVALLYNKAVAINNHNPNTAYKDSVHNKSEYST